MKFRTNHLKTLRKPKNEQSSVWLVGSSSFSRVSVVCCAKPRVVELYDVTQITYSLGDELTLLQFEGNPGLI